MAKTLIGNVKGKDGRGILKIEKTASTGAVDTYTITYTDNTTSTFTVNNSDSVSLQRQIVPSAAVESSTTASQAYAAGDYVVVVGVLRRVTKSISKGSAISDSNSHATNVGDEMKGISNTLATRDTYGSNGNGNWWKFASGLMICTKRVTFNTTCTNEWFSLYDTPKLSFGATPATFADTPTVTATVVSSSAALIENITDSSKSSFGSVYFCRPDRCETLEVIVDVVAFGRWK